MSLLVSHGRPSNGKRAFVFAFVFAFILSILLFKKSLVISFILALETIFAIKQWYVQF
jgi:hypothetical protein